MPNKKITIKQVLTTNHSWWQFYQKYSNKIRTAIVVSIAKLLSCRNIIRGYHQYRCSNKDCSHIKYIHHTCKSKACSSCGKKATELWIQKQNNILPKTEWQHITFTMPSELWDFFWHNRPLLHKISAIAADCIKTIAYQKGVIPGIFIAIHTFGRDLKRNVHIHLSTTTGGLSLDLTQWKNVYFNQTTLMRLWRCRIIQLFRNESLKGLSIPSTLSKQLNHTFTFNQFLDSLYKKTWIVHCSKPTQDHKLNISYFGRYVKRPAIAESKLKHYNGNTISFRYLDHTTKTYRQFKLTVEQFIARFIQHIPDLNFRMIRYYGFLANRVRGNLLPHVYQLIGQNKNDTKSIPPTYADLIKKDFGFDPLTCILCGHALVLSHIHFGKTRIFELLQHHQQLALLKNV